MAESVRCAVVILTLFALPAAAGTLLYETNENGNTVGVYTVAGQLTGTLNPALPFSVPYVVIADPAGNVYVSDYSNDRIVEFSAGGNQIASFTGELGNPGGLALDDAGNLYAVDRATGAILKYSGGTETQIATVAGARGLVFRNGTLFTASSTTGAVTSFDTDGGNITTVVASVGSGDLRGVAFDQAGDLFISDAGGGSLFELAAGASSTQLFAAGLLAPEYLVIGSDGTLWVPEYAGGDILRISADGTVLGAIVSGLDHPSSVALVEAPEPALAWAVPLCIAAFVFARRAKAV